MIVKVMDSTQTITQRFSLFPIQDESSYVFYKRQEQRIWSVDDISFVKDKEEYGTLSPGMQHVVDVILSFFLPGDGLVNNNLILRFMAESTSMEEIAFFAAQMFIETVHAETYGLMFFTLYEDSKIAQLDVMVNENPYFKAKVDFIDKWTKSDRSKSERFFAFACIEGIFFSNLFLYIFALRLLGVLDSIRLANEYISADEALHRDYGCYLCNKYGGISRETALEILTEAVMVEKEFSYFLLEKILIDDKDVQKIEITKEGADDFVEVVADNLLVEAGHDPVYNKKNPFTWADDLSLVKKNSFFEKKGSNYTRGSTDSFNWMKRAGRDTSQKQRVASPFDLNF